jgi:hypothetical protein
VCGRFVAAFHKIAPKYDCQRSFDHTPSVDYTVSVVWVCEEILKTQGKGAVLEDYIILLQKLKTKDARCFFASTEFRSILDGYLAEEFLEESLRAEKDTPDLSCPLTESIE